MRKLAIVIVFALLSCEAGFSQPKQLRDQPAKQLRDQPKGVQQGRRGNVQPRRAILQLREVVASFYVTQLRRAVEVSDDVFVKVQPFVEQFIQDRFEITDRRRRAFNQLGMAINSGASDEDVLRLVRELDNADAEVQSNQQDFMRNVDPLLNTRQQGKLRVFLDTTDQRIRQMLNGIQNNAGAAQPIRPNANQPAR